MLKKIFFVMLLSLNILSAQIAIKPGDEIKEDFNSIENSSAATLPFNWKVERNIKVRTISTYLGADNKTSTAGGTNLSSSASNGAYNFEVGSGSKPNNRAIGGLSSCSGSKSVNIFFFLKNTSNSAIKQEDLFYDVIRLRNGSNSAQFSFQLYYSKNGINWNSAGENFLTSFAKTVSNYGAVVVPLEQKQILNQILCKLIIAPGDSLYLAWKHSITTGTTTSNVHAFAIDNFEVNKISTGETTSVPLTPKIKKATEINCNSFIANWECSASASNYFLDDSTSSSFSTFVSGYSNLSTGNILSKEVSSFSIRLISQLQTEIVFQLTAT